MIPSPRHERRDFRYPLHLPVLIRMAQQKEIHVRSENISLGGILLSSSFLIPEGSAVEVSVGVEHMPDPGILLNARGKVLRVQPRSAGDFAVAIKLEGKFKLPLTDDGASPQRSKEKGKTLPEVQRSAALPLPQANYVPAWHTET
jgi:hypothetical protein